jgi:hypothetical protein
MTAAPIMLVVDDELRSPEALRHTLCNEDGKVADGHAPQ